MNTRPNRIRAVLLTLRMMLWAIPRREIGDFREI
jgi:hypothetical protein